MGESVAGRLGPSYFSLMMLVSVPQEKRESLQQKILELPELSSAVFAVEPGKTTERVHPQIGCECRSC